MNQDDVSVNVMYAKVVGAFNDTAKKILGKVKGKPAKEWLTDATWKLVEEKRNLRPKRRENAESRRHYNFFMQRNKKTKSVGQRLLSTELMRAG